MKAPSTNTRSVQTKMWWHHSTRCGPFSTQVHSASFGFGQSRSSAVGPGMGQSSNKQKLLQMLIQPPSLPNFRYVVLGASSLACRMSALLAIYSVDENRYLGWPSGILGGLCLISVCLCFLLPEPRTTGLPIGTRKICHENNTCPSRVA